MRCLSEVSSVRVQGDPHRGQQRELQREQQREKQRGTRGGFREAAEGPSQGGNRGVSMNWEPQGIRRRVLHMHAQLDPCCALFGFLYVFPAPELGSCLLLLLPATACTVPSQ